MRQYHYYVYTTTNPGKTVLYVDVTNNLVRRMAEHYANRGNRQSFAGRYYCYNLIYVEHHQYVRNAITWEKEIKLMKRVDKDQLIKKMNPTLGFLKVS